MIAVIGPWIAPYDPDTMSNDLLQPPSGAHWFGTTQTGQDVLSQILVGTRGVLVVGFVAGIFATVLSVLIGVSAGFLGGTADEVLSVLSNVFLVIPGLPLIIIIASLVSDAGDLLIATVIAFTSWAWGARVLRAQTLSLRRRDYVEAARATGESTWRIILFEILPNLTAVIASGFVGTVIFAILSEITLAFIGVADISNWNWGTVLFWAQANQALARARGGGSSRPASASPCWASSLALINFGIDEFVNPRLRYARRGASRRVRMRVGFTPVARGTHDAAAAARTTRRPAHERARAHHQRPERGLRHRGRRRARAARHRPHPAPGRGPRPGRRVGLRQVHPRVRRHPAAAHRPA